MAKRAASQLLEKTGLSMKIGFEVEFSIMTSDYLGVEHNCYSNSNSLDAHAKMLEDVCETLFIMGIEVLVAHKETGPGQFEIVLNYGDLMVTLDKYFMAREAIKGVIRKYGFIVSFIPKASSIT